MMIETNKPLIYSNRSCPNGCSWSAGFAAILNPTSVKMDEAVSDKLLIASAMIETLPEKRPIINFATNNNIFEIRPKIPAIMPFLVRSCPLIVFCSFDTFSLPLFFILV